MAGEPSAEFMDAELVHLQSMKLLWFSHTSNHSSSVPVSEQPYRSGSEAPSTRYTDSEIDDQYRQDIQKRLRINPYEPTVPSADSLNVGLRLYFAKAQPVFPVVHEATFRPVRASASLLIAMCALGSLFTGSDQGLQQGTHFFERIHKATLQNWENLMSKSRDTMVSIIHCASVAQVFGMMSGSPQILLTVDAFHGPPIVWARHLNLNRAGGFIPVEPGTNGAELDKIWRKWAYGEQLQRVLHGLYIVDAELASILHREPFQNFESYSFTFTCSDSLFSAPNALDWKVKYLVETRQCHNQPLTLDSRTIFSSSNGICLIPATSRFTAYAILESISIQVLSSQASSLRTPHSAREYDQHLIDFHNRFLNPKESGANPDPLQLNILWHIVFMETFANFNLLEKAVGREGCKLTTSEYSAITAWATSEDASRCILHGLMIRKYVQAMPIISELAIHVPRAIFWAGISLLCYIRFGSLSKGAHPHLSAWNNYPELSLPGMNLSMLINGLKQAELDCSLSLKTILFSMIDLLNHAGHWGIARKFAVILTTASNFALGYTQICV